jgi:hypothetical protein
VLTVTYNCKFRQPSTNSYPSNIYSHKQPLPQRRLPRRKRHL